MVKDWDVIQSIYVIRFLKGVVNIRFFGPFQIIVIKMMKVKELITQDTRDYYFIIIWQHLKCGLVM